MKLKKWIEENVAILESTKRLCCRKCVNYITLFKNYVTHSALHIFNFVTLEIINTYNLKMFDYEREQRSNYSFEFASGR